MSRVEQIGEATSDEMIAKLRNALEEIEASHLPSMPASFTQPSYEWAERHIYHLRSIARKALTP